MPEISYDRQLPALIRAETDDGTATEPAPAAVDVYGNITAAALRPEQPGAYTRLRLTLGDQDLVMPFADGTQTFTAAEVTHGAQLGVVARVVFTPADELRARAMAMSQARPVRSRTRMLARVCASGLAIVAAVAMLADEPAMAVGMALGALAYSITEITTRKSA